MTSWLKKIPEEIRRKARKKKQPEWTEPMLATLTDERFSDEKWIYERKLDGERCLVFINGKNVRLMSRNQKKLNSHYPELVATIENQDAQDFIADGEVVAFKGNVTSFSRLQNRMHIRDEEEARKSGVAVWYYLFDLLYMEGYDLTRIPLRHRKSLLKQVISFQKPVRFVAHRNKEGEAYFSEACRKGWEGIIAKDAQSPYAHSRSKKWLKLKCGAGQELVIGGFTEPEGERIGFGALLLGYYEGDKFRYAGKVGTGFDDKTLKRMHKRMKKIELDSPPFADGEDLPTGRVHWTKPKLVAEIGFEEWTDAGKLRHPRYLGLRDDKDAADVVRETPEPAP